MDISFAYSVNQAFFSKPLCSVYSVLLLPRLDQVDAAAEPSSVPGRHRFYFFFFLLKVQYCFNCGLGTFDFPNNGQCCFSNYI